MDKKAWEHLRGILFMGKAYQADSPLTQEEYIAYFEEQLERNPMEEWRLFREAAAPVMERYQKEMIQQERMEQIMSGDPEAPAVERDDDDWVELLHEDIIHLESEAEWEMFLKRFVK